MHNVRMYVCVYNVLIGTYCPGDPPEIDEGSFVPRPSNVQEGDKRVKIGTTAYVHDRFAVIIECYIVNGTPPITIQWFHNGLPDLTRGNDPNITITDARNGDVFKCRADNNVGFDIESTTVYVECGMSVYMFIN